MPIIINDLLPLHVQHAVRDSGAFRVAANSISSIVAFVLCLSRPHLVRDFIATSLSMKRIRYGRSNQQILDILRLSSCSIDNNISREKRAVIFIHGGAWGSGQTWMYRLMAKGLAQLMGADHSIVVGYDVYPIADIGAQVESITNAVQYIDANRLDLGLSDDTKLILSGHSSGANICALALLKAQQNTLLVSDQTAARMYTDTEISSMEDGTYCLLNVKAFVGIAGVYDLEHHYAFESRRGVQHISPMAGASGKMFRKWSPTHLLRVENKMKCGEEPLPSSKGVSGCEEGGDNRDRERDTAAHNDSSSSTRGGRGYESEKTTMSRRFPPTLLLHCVDDFTVSYANSHEFAKELDGNGVHVISCFPPGHHVAPVLDLSTGSETPCMQSLRAASEQLLRMTVMGPTTASSSL